MRRGRCSLCSPPLRIGMLARQLRHHPARTATELAAELAAARDRLALMRAENVSVAAAFSLSYTDLTAAQPRLFRRVGRDEQLPGRPRLLGSVRRPPPDRPHRRAAG